MNRDGSGNVHDIRRLLLVLFTLGLFNKCGEWTLLFATFMSDVKILLDIAALEQILISIVFDVFRITVDFTALFYYFTNIYKYQGGHRY